MRFVTFSIDAKACIGVMSDDEVVVDLSVADPNLPQDMAGMVALGQDGIETVMNVLKEVPDNAKRGLTDISLLAPFPKPGRNIMCVGKNYHAHAREFYKSGFDATAGAQAAPDYPIIFTKATTSVIGPNTPIPLPGDLSSSIDYEGELAVVIGKEGQRISKAAAFDYVYGYTIVNDVTARDIQKKHKQWFIGKSLDGFCPMGPYLVTADEVGDVSQLHLITRVNGEIRQDAKAADLIFDIPTLIATISAGITLLPGDIIATGTPAGVGIGFDPPKFLRPGDTVSISIDHLGTLENPVA